MSDRDLRSLLTWLSTFELQAPHASVEDISSGVALAEALVQIAPEWFTESWFGKMKRDAAAMNWRVKVSNLKKVIETVVEYYVVCLNQALIGYARPDAQKIAEHCDVDESRKLLQLVLGCAVNCQEKQHFIIRIMGLEVNVQQVIMQNIQDLEKNISGVGANMNFESLGESDRAQQKLLLDELQAATEQKDQLLHKCAELDQQLCVLQDENSALHSQNNRLQSRLTELRDLEGDAAKTSHKLLELQKQVESSKDEIFKLETSRDDCLSRIEALQKERTELQRKQLEWQKAAEGASNLKDELDALRETADKVTRYEVAIEAYKKKMDDFAASRKQLKQLEEKNAEYLRSKLDLEEEVKRSGALRSHLDACKKQLAEARRKLDEQTHRSENLEFEARKLEAELDSTRRDKERALAECSALRETNEELRCNQLITTENIMYVSGGEEAAANTDFVPPSVRERLVLLEHENKMLRLSQQKDSEDVPLQALLDDSEERVNDLRAQNRQANQTIAELESKLEELRGTRTSESKREQQKIQSLQDNVRQLQAECERLSSRDDESDNELQLHKRKVLALQEHLSRKDRELAALEERYKRYVDKAKAVIKILDPREQVSSLNLHSLSRLRSRIGAERKQAIEDAKRAKSCLVEDKENVVARNDEETKAINEQEEAMMTTAFHNFGFKKYRDIADKRVETTSASFAPSFMSLQRAPTARKASTVSFSRFM